MTTPGLFRFPIRSADVWGLQDEQKRSNEDIAADLDYQDNSIEGFLSDVTSAANVATFGESMAKGREAAAFVSATSYSSSAAYGFTFSNTPRIILSVECGRGQDLRPILTSVSATGFSYKITAASTSTTTLYVHWVAVSA
jgi:hypothetical protein